MTEIKKSVYAAGRKAQYDERAKRLLGHKIILAHILVRTVPEFKGMNPKDVAPLIEGEPLIGSVPVEPGLTNAADKRMAGFNSEDGELNEGLVRFDVVCYVRMKDGLSQIILNLEAQRRLPRNYAIFNRAGFYVSRLISSQKGRDFENSNFDDIRPVYSIWVLMNMEENSLTHVHLSREDFLGSLELKGHMDMFNVIFIGLSKELTEEKVEQELHRLLGVLLSPVMDAKGKLEIMESEYEIPVEDGIRRELDEMCNLSEGIWEEGKEEGKEEAITSIVLQMERKGFTAKEIADILDRKEEEIKEILSGRKPVLV